jgi:hypothetical protein
MCLPPLPEPHDGGTAVQAFRRERPDSITQNGVLKAAVRPAILISVVILHVSQQRDCLRSID